MTGASAERFRNLVHRRVLPGLAELGFRDRLRGSLAASQAEGVLWLLDLDVAPWSAPRKVCFTVSWGVHVPGIDEVLGDPRPDVPTVDTSAVRGRLGEREGGVDPRWFELRSAPRFVANVSDAVLANNVLERVGAELLPRFGALRTPADVQRQLYEGLVTGRGVPREEELRTIRRIAALSLMLGDRTNAARWLDHLEARSSAAMAPDLVAERLAPLRERLAS